MNNYIPYNLPICPKCKDFPLLKLTNQEPEKIKIKCNCGYDKEIYLENYINKQNDNVNNKKNKKFYCKQCKEYLKEKYDIKHKNHTIIDLRRMIDIREYKEKYLNGKEHIEVYMYELKEKYIQELNNTINEIEEAYNQCKKSNELLLRFTNNLIMSYSYKNLNYNLISNIQRNCVYNISSFTYQIKENKYSYLINYIKTYNILQPKLSLDSLDIVDCISSHKDYVRNLLLLNDGRFASCSDDYRVIIYNQNTFKSEITITNFGSVSSIIQLPSNELVFPDDYSIKFTILFDTLYSYNYIIKRAHDDVINSLILLSDNRIASSADDYKIKIWNTKSYECIAIFYKHSDTITTVLSLKCKDSLISTSFDNTLIIWNLLSYQPESIIEGIECWTPNGLIEISNKRILIARGQMISVMNVFTYEIENSIEDDINFRCFCSLTENEIMFGCDKCIIGIYDIIKNKISYKESLHTNHISSIIKINSDTILTSSWDETINVWKINKINK